MKIIDMYFNYKEKYSEYIVLMKIGYFFEIYGEDSKTMNALFGYNIKKYYNTYRCGFPVNSLNKVLDKLKENKINYVIVDKVNVISKKKFRENNYKSQMSKLEIQNRIKDINLKLKNNINRYDINELLNKIEELI